MKNTFEIHGKTVIVHAYGLGATHEILVDLYDLPLVASIPGTWGAVRLGGIMYAGYDVPSRTGKKYKLLMHRMLMNPLLGFEIDHIDHSGLNNTRRNLRVTTHQGNLLNCRRRKNNTSGHTGVRFERGKWRAKTSVDGRTGYVGTFETKEQAIAAYDAAFKNLTGFK